MDLMPMLWYQMKRVTNAIKLIKKIDKGETITQADIDHQNELVSKAG